MKAAHPRRRSQPASKPAARRAPASAGSQPAAPVRGGLPRRALEVAWLHVASRALAVAVELGLFPAVGEGATAAEAALRAKVSERGARLLLDALCPFGLVIKEGRRYRLGDEARATLLPDAPGYVGENVIAMDRRRRDWEDNLADAVRTGRPAIAVDTEEDARVFFPAIARMLYRSNLPVAEKAAERLADLGLKPRRILDVAAGSGVWGIAAARRFPEATVTALDFEEVLGETRDRVAEDGVASRFNYLSGNLRELDLGDGLTGGAGYDLVLLGHILHSEGEARSRELLLRVARALRPGGMVLIAEFIPDEGRRERLMPLLFGLNMLLRTREGDVFTLPEIRSWLIAAGFERVTAFDAGGGSPLVIARRVRRASKPRRTGGAA